MAYHTNMIQHLIFMLQCMMHWPYKRDSDYCNAQKLTLHSKSMIKYYLYATKEDAYCIDNKDSHIKEILREIAAKQQKEQHSIPEVPDAPDEDSVTQEQIQSLLEEQCYR